MHWKPGSGVDKNAKPQNKKSKPESMAAVKTNVVTGGRKTRSMG